MQGIIVDRALHGSRIPHVPGAVQHLDRLLGGQAGSDQLSSTRKSQHQVRLDETEGNVEVGGNETGVDMDGRA